MTKLNRWPTREQRQTFCKELETVMRLVPDELQSDSAKEYLNEAAHLMRRFAALEIPAEDMLKEVRTLRKRGEELFQKKGT